jgi:phosphate-selective porin OprO/OprP
MALLALALLTVASHATEADEIKELREQIRQLELKLLAIERRQELRDKEASAPAPAPIANAPKVTISEKGFAAASPDGANSIKLRGLLQLDSRLFMGDEALNNNAFVLRRARLGTDGVMAKDYAFQLMAEFGGSSVSVVDANLNIAISKALQFRLGRFKVPVGLEQLQSDSWTFFNERSIASNLVPSRDLGIQAWGVVGGGRLDYAVGVFNGVGDGASSNNSDFDNDKELAARFIASPFKDQAGSALQGLSLGVGGSIGRNKTASGRTGGYRTDGQQTFFAYNAATIADGANWRFSPQFDYRHGSFGLLGEYIVSTVNVRPGATGAKAELQNEAWHLAAGYVLTGEDSSPGGVVPRVSFSPADGAWGALEVTARTASVKIDDATYPLYASPSSTANEAASFGLGLNWYLSRAVVFKFDYYQTDFGFNPAAPAVSSSAVLRQDEKVFISRFQFGF